MPNSHSGIVASPSIILPCPAPLGVPNDKFPIAVAAAIFVLCLAATMRHSYRYECSYRCRYCDTDADADTFTIRRTAHTILRVLRSNYCVTCEKATQRNNNNRNRNVRLSDTFVSAYLRPCNRRGVSVAEHFRPLRMRAAV